MKKLTLVVAMAVLSGCVSTVSTPAPRPAPSTKPLATEDAAAAQILPLVKVAAVYPRRALQRGQEGWVMVEFDVDANGNVINPRVVDSSPKDADFEENALAAVLQFKYSTQEEVKGLQNLIRFEIASD